MPRTPRTRAASAPTGEPARGSTVSRRTLLGGLGGLSAAAALSALGGVLPTAARAATGTDAAPALVAALPAGLPDRRAFAAIEQRVAAYLGDIAPITNGISLAPDTYGWLRGGWGGRSPDAPYNARVQENVDTLSWFYANARDWNPYAGDPALLARLDIAVGYYLGLQHPDGSWSEYSPDEHSRAATGFGLSFLSQTLAELTRSNALPATRERIATALRSAAVWFLDPTNASVYTTPIQEYANQAVAGIFGAFEAQQVGAATGLDAQIAERLQYLHDKSQSAAGFFYEPHGQDLGYNFEVMLPDLAKLYGATGNALVLDMAVKFYDWLGYNMLREPDGAGFIGNVASSARTSMNFLDDVTDDSYKAGPNGLFVPGVAAAAAFEPTRQDKQALRAAFAASTDPVTPFSPYYTYPALLRDLQYGEYFPDTAEKADAIAALPYLDRTERTEYRTDPTGAPLGQQWVFVRRPGVYVGAHFGTRASGIVRTGPAFVWNRALGTVVHSLNNTTDSCWGTTLTGTAPDTASDLAATYFAGDPACGEQVGDPRAVGGGPLGLRWSAFTGALTKEVTVQAGRVTSRTIASAPATEQIPVILHPDDVVAFDDGTAAGYLVTTSARSTGLTLRRNGVTVSITWDAPVPATLTPRSARYFRAKDRALHVLTLPHGGRLQYDVRLPVGPNP